MFRTQQNPFDELVVKATDENLISENWEYILDVCDKVASEESGGKDVVAAIIKRLAHRNANVQLYTLELANALSQNGGLKVHKELASRSFTEALLRLANDRNTHQQVKTKILERMSDWTEMFSTDPDLGIMEQAYARLKTQNPNLHPPSKPVKTQITEADRRKEEEELQMALALSINDKANSSSASGKRSTQAKTSSLPAAAIDAVPTSQPQAVAPGTTAATVSRVRALFDFQPSEPGELQFRKGDIIAVLESVYKDWWKGSLRGETGIFPLNYVEKLQDPTREELEREAQMEAEVFAEIRNVEKLLALLSTSSMTGDGDVRDNEEITALYHSTLAIRPKLIELIGKYSQKKDDFTQLNEKFIKARRDYEALLEASMSQPTQSSYGRPPYGYNAGTVYGGGYGLRLQAGTQQNDPQRLYSPAPQPDQQPSFPPRNGPQPFYLPPSNSQPQQYPTQQPQISHHSPTQTTPKPHPADSFAPTNTSMVGRPQSFATPQELASSTYDTPIDGRSGFITQQQMQGPGQSYTAYPQAQSQTPYPSQQQQQAVPPQPYDSPSSIYSSNPENLLNTAQQQHPPMTSHVPPVAPLSGPMSAMPPSTRHSGIPGSGTGPKDGSGGTGYIAYQPPQALQVGQVQVQDSGQVWRGTSGGGTEPFR